MTTQCAIEGCGHPVTPCTGACTSKIEQWRTEAKADVARTPLPIIEPNLVKSAPDSIDNTLIERGQRYGKFINHAFITQELKRVIGEQLAERKVVLADDQKEALAMICHKIGRIINGDPNYADSWVDIAGYAKLVADRLQGVVR